MAKMRILIKGNNTEIKYALVACKSSWYLNACILLNTIQFQSNIIVYFFQFYLDFILLLFLISFDLFFFLVYIFCFPSDISLHDIYLHLFSFVRVSIFYSSLINCYIPSQSQIFYIYTKTAFYLAIYSLILSKLFSFFNSHFYLFFPTTNFNSIIFEPWRFSTASVSCSSQVFAVTEKIIL